MHTQSESNQQAEKSKVSFPTGTRIILAGNSDYLNALAKKYGDMPIIEVAKREREAAANG